MASGLKKEANQRTQYSFQAEEEVVKLAYEEQGFEKPSVETAIWRLKQQGQIYQPGQEK